MLRIILYIALVGVLLYAVEKYVPMDPGVRQVLRIVVIVLLVLSLLSLVGFDLPYITFRR